MYRKSKTVNNKSRAQITTCLLQRIPILEYKWERIGKDFMVGLPKTLGKYESTWVLMDRLRKSAHFYLVWVDYSS